VISEEVGKSKNHDHTAASRAEVIGMVQRECLQLLAVGAAIGIPAAFGAMRIVAAQLPGLRAVNIVTVATVVAVMTSARLLAPDPCVACRASRPDAGPAHRVRVDAGDYFFFSVTCRTTRRRLPPRNFLIRCSDHPRFSMASVSSGRSETSRMPLGSVGPPSKSDPSMT